MRRGLAAQLQVGSSELDSIFRLVRSKLEMSLRRALDTPGLGTP